MQTLIIGSNIKVMYPCEEVIEYCKDKLTLNNPDYIQAERNGRYTGNIPKKLLLYTKSAEVYTLPFGCLQDVWKLAKEKKYLLQIHDFIGNKMQGNINLYDYQEKAKNALISARNGVLEAPCGSGKTIIGLELIKELGGKALWLTHTKKLLEQSMDRCKAHFNGEYGTITEGAVNIGRDITFATVQTMSKLDAELYKNEFDIVVVDEAHHCVGAPTRMMQFYKVVSNCNARYKFGLSATLTRSDELIQSLYALIGPKVYTIQKEEIGDKIIKAKHIKVEIDIPYSIRDYAKFDGTIDYTKLINTLSNSEERNKMIVEKVVACDCIGKKQIVLCLRVAQAETLAKAISQYTSCSLVTGSVKEKERSYDSNVIVATYALAKEGLDIPTLDVVHLATPSKDKITVVQSVGRVERNVPGKEQPMCFDYVDMQIPYCVNAYKIRARYLKK